MTDIENNSVTGGLKNVPKEILGKLGISPEYNDSDSIELTILVGENTASVQNKIEALNGKFYDLGYGYAIVEILISQIVLLAQMPEIQYIEFPKSLYYTDSLSNKISCVDMVRSQYGLYGRGVLIGFIDTGIDYTAEAFRTADGTTRVEYIYDLSLGGEIYSKNQINQALQEKDPYSVVPSQDIIGHGTHVAGIACAGGNIDRDYYGVAPESSIIMVKSSRGLFSLSTNIMKGLKFLIDKSNELNMPLVVNISLSTNDGAHNGSSLLEQYISTISKSERVTIVIAAGNEGNASHHIGGNLEETTMINFSISGDETYVVMNLYKSILPQISLEIISPRGIGTGEIIIKEGLVEGIVSGNRYRIYDTGPKPFDISGEIGISLVNDNYYILEGVWTLKIKVLNKYKGIYDIWLPISEGLNKNTKFLSPTVDGTLGIPATVPNVISVGSYNPINKNISSFSGRGRSYPLYFEIKPTIVAPGEDIIAPVPYGIYDRKTGTSMATPHISGMSALLMEWGILKGNDSYLYGERLKYYMIIGARKKRTDIEYPNTSWGYGEACLEETIKALINSIGVIQQNRMFIRVPSKLSINVNRIKLEQIL
ncbi:S8 family serine peptidase [Clostridium sp. MSJ-8]|uniref:S8 family serine peptidase n=1 Tax=Clostridium sp. MSJ-8 TaxID=2841510 RepID=UPI001C0EF7AE|nr:S8 family serine peptidase [Clostridium sp. MSJ-8]